MRKEQDPNRPSITVLAAKKIKEACALSADLRSCNIMGGVSGGGLDTHERDSRLRAARGGLARLEVGIEESGGDG